MDSLTKCLYDNHRDNIAGGQDAHLAVLEKKVNNKHCIDCFV